MTMHGAAVGNTWFFRMPFVMMYISFIKAEAIEAFALGFIQSLSHANGVFRNAFLGNGRVDNFRQSC